MALANRILVVGLPKCGTSSLESFFRCGGLKTSHWRCKGMMCGQCLNKAYSEKRPGLANCGDFEAWTQLDSWYSPCHVPQVTNFEDLVADAPNATFVLNIRPVKHWLSSVTRWPRLRKQMRGCKLNRSLITDAQVVAFYESHVSNMIQKLQGLRHIVVDIEHKAAGAKLSQFFGIKTSCWGHKNKNKKK